MNNLIIYIERLKNVHVLLSSDFIFSGLFRKQKKQKVFWHKDIHTLFIVANAKISNNKRIVK